MGVAGDRRVAEGGRSIQTALVQLFPGLWWEHVLAVLQLPPPPVSFGLQPGLGASGLGIFRLSCLEQ